MSRVPTLQALFKRYRRPGDLVFACIFLAVSVLLMSQISEETSSRAGAKIFIQPWFWPFVSLFGMSMFASLHLLGSVLSERIEGRWKEVGLWIASLEYGVWFVVYALSVPYVGYLLATFLMVIVLVLRAGYRSRVVLVSACASSFVIVLVFKTFLRVKLPAGELYDILPEGLRLFMLTYF